MREERRILLSSYNDRGRRKIETWKGHKNTHTHTHTIYLSISGLSLRLSLESGIWPQKNPFSFFILHRLLSIYIHFLLLLFLLVVLYECVFYSVVWCFPQFCLLCLSHRLDISAVLCVWCKYGGKKACAWSERETFARDYGVKFIWMNETIEI